MNNSPAMKYEDLRDEQNLSPISKPTQNNMRKQKPKLSLDQLDMYESRRVVDSPLSIKACKVEGILPKELLYKYQIYHFRPYLIRPLEDYLKQCKDPQMAELKYKINEAKRQKNIELIKDTRIRLLQSMKVDSPVNAYKQENVNFFKKTLYKNQGKHQSSTNLKNINQGGFGQSIQNYSNTPMYSRQYGVESGQASPMINSRYLSSRFSTRASMTSARKFLRQYSKSDKIVDNALYNHNQALEQKISSVNLDFTKDVQKFKFMVNQEKERLQRNKAFNQQLEKYNTMKEQFIATLERKLKEKSDQIIEDRIKREVQTQQHIFREKYRFKREVNHRENLELNIQNENQQKFQRIQSAKLLNHMKRLEVYKKAEEDLGQNISYLKNKVTSKEKKLMQQKTRLEVERQQWKQQFIRMRQQQEMAKQRLDMIEREKFSPEVKSQHLMRLYSDINDKEKKWKENRDRQIYRLNSANKIKEIKVKQAYQNFENEIQIKSSQQQHQEMQKKNFIDKISKLKEDQVKKRATVFEIKKQIAESNKKHQERQKSYEAQEISSKIQDHQKAHQNFSQLKNGIEMKRIMFQFDLEKRKQEIRETLFRMQIWNVWDERVLEQVFQRPKGTSIDTVVRQFISANYPNARKQQATNSQQNQPEDQGKNEDSYSMDAE